MNQGRVESVNVGGKRPLIVRGAQVETGIFKTSQEGSLRISATGLPGDCRVEPRKHGEENHALHAYPAEHFDYWTKRCGAGPFEPGGLGENLTVWGASEATVCIGDLIECGSAVLTVSQPRIPCRKLTQRVGVPDFARMFLESLRVGYFLRVERPGWVSAGSSFRVVDRDAASPTVAEFTRISQIDYWDADGLVRLLAARSLPPSWAEVLQSKLGRAHDAIQRGGWFGSRRFRVIASSVEGSEGTLLTLQCAQGQELPRYRAGRFLTLVVTSGPHRGVRRLCRILGRSRPDCYDVAIERTATAVLGALQIGDTIRCLASD